MFILLIVYPDVIEYRNNNNNTDTKEINQKAFKSKSKKRQLLSGTIDQIGKDVSKIKEMGVDHLILNFNRSPISNNIDNIIDVSRRAFWFCKIKFMTIFY